MTSLICPPLFLFILLLFSAFLISQIWPTKGLLVPASWGRKNKMFGKKQRKKVSAYGARGKCVLKLREVYAQRQMHRLWIKCLKRLQTKREDLTASDHPQSSLSLQQVPHKTQCRVENCIQIRTSRKPTTQLWGLCSHIYKEKNRNVEKDWRRRKSKPMNVCPTFWLHRADSHPADDESHSLSHGGKLIDISCLHTCSHSASGCAAMSPVIKIYLSFQGLRRWSEQQGGETRKWCG